MCTVVETIVIVDGIDLLGQAIAAARQARPADHLEYTIYGFDQCQVVPDGHGGQMHVHAFGDNVAQMQKGMEARKAADKFGGYLYATRTPDAPHVIRHCNEMERLALDARPHILQLV